VGKDEETVEMQLEQLQRKEEERDLEQETKTFSSS
jgi:hypothetical protein